MIPSRIKAPLRFLRNAVIDAHNARHMKAIMRTGSGSPQVDFDFDKTAARVLGFVNSMSADSSGIRFHYSDNCHAATLYASAYACMTYSLVGELKNIDGSRKQAWIDYFDSHQSPRDGLFHDPAVHNSLFDTADWWGARHLALHMISAYTDLGGRPRYPFKFLQAYHAPDFIANWLDAYDWNGSGIGSGDIDNQIMNIGCLLQYQRDTWCDAEAAETVERLKTYLLKKRRPDTGMWGGFHIQSPEQRSRLIQFAYHLFPIFFYDKHIDFEHEKIISLALQTQNEIGGYGVKLNSSACEDIDSIDIIIRLTPYVSQETRRRISSSIERALRWVCANQVKDGGFVFRLNESFEYGHKNLSSVANHGAMLPTWFRLLSIVYMARYLAIGNTAVITPCPGYEF